jgi:hypothetical protein
MEKMDHKKKRFNEVEHEFEKKSRNFQKPQKNEDFFHGFKTRVISSTNEENPIVSAC